MARVKNLFTEAKEAKRYNLYRPVYHHLPFEQLSQFFGRKIPRALDVACGTGHSTRALAKISESVIGCDNSDGMLTEARKSSSIQFQLAQAEGLPFGDSEFDYVNISMAYQWLNQPIFLQEAGRILKLNGFLGVDNYGFIGRMVGDERFLEKYKAFDREHMKPVPRNKGYPEESDLQGTCFRIVRELTYDHEVVMSKHQFNNYLMTRSNFLELPVEERQVVELKLDNYYDSSFGSENKILLFRGMLKLLQRVV